MAYTVDYSNSTQANPNAITVNDGTIDTTTSLSLVGKNYYGYGEAIAENFLHMLENFASATQPANGTQGQIWYDTGNTEFKYFDGAAWVGFKAGGMQVLVIQDNQGNDKSVIAMNVNSTYIAIYSPYDQFTVSTTHVQSQPIQAIWTQINKGINLNTTTGSGDVFKLHGTATSAEYADVAEMYTSDANYEPGTVVMIGGEAEVTQTTEAFSPEVFGIVSTDPAYLMNSMTEGVAVALEGRVPCKVIGPVRKGQRLVSSEEPGVARAVSDYERQEALDWYRIVGRALADKTSEGVELIEVVVGIK